MASTYSWRTPMHPNISSRRVHSAELKARILAECRQPGASVSGVAIAHGLNTNVVRKWRPPNFGGHPCIPIAPVAGGTPRIPYLLPESRLTVRRPASSSV
ncbi:hypothetical protein GCM10023165_37720 [Variovorax defluvii]|uniref:Transposase n=1 Tax=Variovorax defluvii TaxID=913761 RepID=A0ABP8I366_9BURK